MPVISRTITALDIAMPQRRRPDLFDFRPQPSPAVHTRCPCSTRSPEAFEKGTKSLLSGTRRAFSRGMARAPPAACGVRTAAASAVADIHRPCHHDQSPPHTRTNSRVTFSEGSARPASAAASALFETAHRRAIFQKGRSPLSVRSARSSPANRSTGPAVGSSGRICRPISAPLVLDKSSAPHCPEYFQLDYQWSYMEGNSQPSGRTTHEEGSSCCARGLRSAARPSSAATTPSSRPPSVLRARAGGCRDGRISGGDVRPLPHTAPPLSKTESSANGEGCPVFRAWG